FIDYYTYTRHSHLLLILLRRPPTSPLFPYTTLFRSSPGTQVGKPPAGCLFHFPGYATATNYRSAKVRQSIRSILRNWQYGTDRRSEEHTSELQSHLNLVCRLLLEKKKTT